MLQELTQVWVIDHSLLSLQQPASPLWAPAGMGKGGIFPLEKVFCDLVFAVKRSSDELFMHYFHIFSSRVSIYMMLNLFSWSSAGY